MVLIELRVHRADLTLPKDVVQRVVDGRWSNSQPGSGNAVDHQRHGKPAGLLVAGHVFQLRQLRERREELRAPRA